MATNDTSPKPFDLNTSRVRLERSKRGWTVIQLATAAGVSPATITAAERGYIPDGVANRLSRVLGLPVAALKPRRDPEAL
jgi:transcriptional regulator with XRE-family HTH domain